MKKFIVAIVLIVACAGMADAQITINKSISSNPKQMTTLSMYWSWIYQIDSTYFLVMKSDNEFDDFYWIRLGTTRGECKESVSSLLELAKTIGETDRYDMDNGMGDTYHISQYNALGMKGLYFYDVNQAGHAYILASNLKKADRWISKNVKE